MRDLIAQSLVVACKRVRGERVKIFTEILDHALVIEDAKPCYLSIGSTVVVGALYLIGFAETSREFAKHCLEA
ncbi:MAG: hypothetical protein NVSMB64_15410 [Candidatus Velthaea sp.]